jgi:hypothetical protein
MVEINSSTIKRVGNIKDKIVMIASNETNRTVVDIF